MIPSLLKGIGFVESDSEPGWVRVESYRKYGGYGGYYAVTLSKATGLYTLWSMNAPHRFYRQRVTHKNRKPSSTELLTARDVREIVDSIVKALPRYRRCGRRHMWWHHSRRFLDRSSA